MKRTWLVQRLTRPVETADGELFSENPFSFGGGRKSGGLSDEAMDALRPLFGFDYMGADEYEYGAVAESLADLAARAADTGGAYEFRVNTKSGTLWVVTDINASQLDICQRVKDLASGKVGDRDDTAYSMQHAVDSDSEVFKRVVGWLDIANAYLIFTEESRAKAAADLFSGREES